MCMNWEFPRRSSKRNKNDKNKDKVEYVVLYLCQCQCFKIPFCTYDVLYNVNVCVETDVKGNLFPTIKYSESNANRKSKEQKKNGNEETSMHVLSAFSLS